MVNKYTTLVDGTSRGSQQVLNYVVNKTSPVMQVAKDSIETSIFLFVCLFFIFAILFCGIVFFNLRKSNEDL